MPAACGHAVCSPESVAPEIFRVDRPMDSGKSVAACFVSNMLIAGPEASSRESKVTKRGLGFWSSALRQKNTLEGLTLRPLYCR